MKSETTRITEKIIRKIKYHLVNDKSTFIERAHQYTGLHPQFLQEIWNSDDVPVNSSDQTIQRTVIFETLISFYLDNKMPSTKELFMELYGKIPKQIDIGQFRNIIIEMGFVWLSVNEKRLVVFERPLVTFERYEYLNKIISYRKEQRNIVNICELAYDFLGNCYDTEQSTRLNKLFPSVKQSCWIYAITHNSVYNWRKVEKFDEPSFQDYVTDLAKDFNTPTVFVYDKSKHHNERVCEVPNLRALKVDLMKWLDMHNIPYDPEANKYHLYELTQKYVDVDESLFKADIMLEAQGHIVLRIPNCVKEFCPGYFIAKTIQDHLNSSRKVSVPSGSGETTTQNLIGSPKTDEKNLKAYNEAFITVARFDVCNILKLADISGHEIKMLDTDIKIDSIMDEVRAKCYEVAEESDMNDLDSELPSCSDSD